MDETIGAVSCQYSLHLCEKFKTEQLPTLLLFKKSENKFCIHRYKRDLYHITEFWNLKCKDYEMYDIPTDLEYHSEDNFQAQKNEDTKVIEVKSQRQLIR